jgi:hypothetical protein
LIEVAVHAIDVDAILDLAQCGARFPLPGGPREGLPTVVGRGVIE